jgi:hypothetical protein
MAFRGFGGGGGSAANKLGIDIDMNLEDEIAKWNEENGNGEQADDPKKLFPVCLFSE